MGISRLLLLIAIIILVWLVIRMVTQARVGSQQQKKEHVDDMVRCRFCGTHLPRADAIKRGDKFYCCEDHSRQA